MTGPVRDMEFDDPRAEPDAVSERSRGVALALALVGGPLSLHRFYVGRAKSGVWMLLTLGGLGIWWLYDLVMLASGEFRDGAGRWVRRWQVDEPHLHRSGDRRVDELSDQVDRLERQVAELGERLDFAERMLTQQRERDKLPGR